MKNLFTILILLYFGSFLIAQELPKTLLPHEIISFNKTGKTTSVQKSAANWRLLATKHQVFNNVWQNSDSSAYRYYMQDLENRITDYTWNGSNWDSIYYFESFYDLNDRVYLRYDYVRNAGVWEKSSKDSTVYDLNSNVTEHYYSVWNSTQWENQSRDFYGYNALGLDTLTLFEVWSGTVWVNNSKTVKDYDISGNLIKNSDYSWNGTSWDNLSSFNYAYDVQSNLNYAVSFGGNGAQWDPIDSTIYFYNVSQEIDSLIVFGWNGTSWDLQFKTEYYYDLNNNIDSTIEYFWNASVWEQTYRYEFSYNTQNQLTVSKNYTWNAGWEHIDSVFTDYDANGNEIMKVSYFWNGVLEWDNSFRNSFTYDLNQNMTFSLYENGNGDIWENADRFYFYYEPFFATSVNYALEELFNVYPNPASDLVYINVGELITGKADIRLFGQNGQLVWNKNLQIKSDDILQFSVSDFAPGVYYLQLSAAKKTEVKKMIIR